MNESRTHSPLVGRDAKAIEVEESLKRLGLLYFILTITDGDEYDKFYRDAQAESAHVQSILRSEAGVCSVCGISGVPLSADGPVALICAEDMEAL